MSKPELFQPNNDCGDPISQFYINSHWLLLNSLHIFVLYRPTQLFIASQCLSVSVGAICWGKRVVRNSESEMAAKRRSPGGTSSVTTPRIPLCRPWTLTSESTLDNHSLPHTRQNKDCRGFSDARSWHMAQEMLWMNTSFKNVLYKQQVLKIRETWNRESDLIWGEISMADLLLMFMLMNAYHESMPTSRHILEHIPQGGVWYWRTTRGPILRGMYRCSFSLQ